VAVSTGAVAVSTGALAVSTGAVAVWTGAVAVSTGAVAVSTGALVSWLAASVVVVVGAKVAASVVAVVTVASSCETSVAFMVPTPPLLSRVSSLKSPSGEKPKLRRKSACIWGVFRRRMGCGGPAAGLGRPQVASKSVLIADGDDEAREELARLLELAGYRVRQVARGDEALAAAGEEPPSVAILEIPLQVLSGYEVCRALKSRHGAELAVLFVSGQRTESYDRVAGLLVGADDYLVKPYAADELLARVRQLEVRTRPLAGAVREKLTRRESDVLRLLAQGLTQDEIATRLAIRPKTVGSHIEHVLLKLGVHSRTQAVALALREEATQVAASQVAV
jgi:DNA-binding NarL/FixJ family response regulator